MHRDVGDASIEHRLLLERIAQLKPERCGSRILGLDESLERRRCIFPSCDQSLHLRLESLNGRDVSRVDQSRNAHGVNLSQAGVVAGASTPRWGARRCAPYAVLSRNVQK